MNNPKAPAKRQQAMPSAVKDQVRANKEQALIQLRYGFYRDGFRLLLITTPLIVAALIVACVVAAKALSAPVLTRYVAVDRNNRVIPIVPKSERFVSDGDLSKFAAEAILRSYRIDGVNYNSEILDLANFFTGPGFEGFKKMLADSKTVEFLAASKSVASPEPLGPAVIVRTMVTDGVFQWEVRMPIKVNYIGTTSGSRTFVVDVVIDRMETIERPDAVGISQFNAFEQR